MAQLRRSALLGAVLAAALLRAAVGQTASAAPTTLATTRFTIDNFNYTFNLQTDEPAPNIAAGAIDQFGDGFGTLRATAVMFQPRAGNGLPYLPVRCDILLFKPGGQALNFITDFTLTLYADDEAEGHNPGVRVRAARAPRCLSRHSASRLPLTPRGFRSSPRRSRSRPLRSPS